MGTRPKHSHTQPFANPTIRRLLEKWSIQQTTIIWVLVYLSSVTASLRMQSTYCPRHPLFSNKLRELNEESSKDVTWTIDGTRVIPKSLNVAKLTSSSLKETLTFTHIRRKHIEAPFNRR